MEEKKTKVVKPKKDKIAKVKKKEVKTTRKKNITDLEGNIIKDNNKKKQKRSFKEHIKKYKKIYSLLLLTVAAIALVVSIYFLIRNLVINKKYGPYEEKMNAYGFDIMYNNETAKSSEKVTKLEMIKIILASVYNTTDTESIGFSSQGSFEGDEWVTTAVAFGIIKENDITKENYNDCATFKEALIAYLNARNSEFHIPVGESKEASFKNLNAFTVEERKYINDAAENGLIENRQKRLKIDDNMFKGEFNKLVVTFVEKYGTIIPEGEQIVTKKESLPKNSEIYPYILYSVDKEVYEYEGINEGGVDYATPVETYKYRKDYYPQMQYRTEQYYNTILNVNYNDITTEKFKEETNRFLRYVYPDEYFANYVNYIKENKIIIEGTSKVQLPIFYLDGIDFRARVKLTFEIKEANTDKNILFGDLTRKQEVTYKNKKYTIYVDAPMGRTLFGKGLRLDMQPIIDILVSNKEAKSVNEI